MADMTLAHHVLDLHSAGVIKRDDTALMLCRKCNHPAVLFAWDIPMAKLKELGAKGGLNRVIQEVNLVCINCGHREHGHTKIRIVAITDMDKIPMG